MSFHSATTMIGDRGGRFRTAAMGREEEAGCGEEGTQRQGRQIRHKSASAASGGESAGGDRKILLVR